jgi:hypothetical protein
MRARAAGIPGRVLMGGTGFGADSLRRNGGGVGRVLLVFGLLWHQVVTGPRDEIRAGVVRYTLRLAGIRFLPEEPSHARSLDRAKRWTELLAE